MDKPSKRLLAAIEKEIIPCRLEDAVKLVDRKHLEKLVVHEIFNTREVIRGCMVMLVNDPSPETAQEVAVILFDALEDRYGVEDADAALNRQNVMLHLYPELREGNAATA